MAQLPSSYPSDSSSGSGSSSGDCPSLTSAVSTAAQIPPSQSLSHVEVNSRGSELVVLTSEEIEALKMYSHSVQNFTYKLFESFRLEREARESEEARRDTSAQSTSTQTPPSQNKSKNADSLFKTTVIPIETSPVPTYYSRKPSDYPRRKTRSHPFPPDTGL